MRTTLLQCALVLLSVSGVVMLHASTGLSQTTRGPTQDQMIVEPGDPPAQYDAARGDWFVRQTVLAEPDAGAPPSGFTVAFLQTTNMAAINSRDPAALGAWGSPIMDSLEKILETVDLDQPLIVAITLSPRDEPSFGITPSKQLSPEVRQKITDTLAGQTPPRPRFVDCCLAFDYHPRGMQGRDDPGIPASLYPAWRESRQYQNASLAEKVQMIAKWSREQVVPLLAGAASQVDPNFAGVRAFGSEVLSLKMGGKIDVEKITFRNPNFWQAVMEMTPRDVTILACQISLFAANGELDKAGRLLKFMPDVSGRDHLACLLLAKLGGRMRGVETATGKRIEQGIQLFDSQQYQKAVAVYESIVKDNPSSAAAQHELMLTRVKMTGSGEVARDYDARVYGRDPLYPTAPVHVATGERLYRGLLRRSIRDLFRDEAKWREDYARYAQIALDVGEYGYAAMLYWELFTRVTPGDAEAMRHCLYCLERLGVPQIKAHFKPELSTGFDKIDQARRKRMEENPAYKAMKK
jgi:hypothetical protein